MDHTMGREYEGYSQKSQLYGFLKKEINCFKLKFKKANKQINK